MRKTKCGQKKGRLALGGKIVVNQRLNSSPLFRHIVTRQSNKEQENSQSEKCIILDRSAGTDKNDTDYGERAIIKLVCFFLHDKQGFVFDAVCSFFAGQGLSDSRQCPLAVDQIN